MRPRLDGHPPTVAPDFPERARLWAVLASNPRRRIASKAIALISGAVVALALLFAGTSTALRPTLTHNPCPRHVSVSAFQEFAESTWRLPSWERGPPKAKTIAAAHHQIYCARGTGRRGALKQRWREAQRAFYEHRRAELWRVRVTPYCSGGQCYALPLPIVICESGGNYSFTYGAYSILDPAWHAWGGKTAHAGEASKREQDRVAHFGYSHYGESPWECKGDGSTSWP